MYWKVCRLAVKCRLRVESLHSFSERASDEETKFFEERNTNERVSGSDNVKIDVGNYDWIATDCNC